jgi:hypothetical protein
MHYDHIAIPDADVPQAVDPVFQHVLQTYTSEANKTVCMWRAVPDDLLDFKPHEKTNPIRTIMVHQLLSERRFFAQFVGTERTSTPATSNEYRLRHDKPSDLTNSSPNWDKASPSVKRTAASLSSTGTQSGNGISTIRCEPEAVCTSRIAANKSLSSLSASRRTTGQRRW